MLLGRGRASRQQAHQRRDRARGGDRGPRRAAARPAHADEAAQRPRRLLLGDGRPRRQRPDQRRRPARVDDLGAPRVAGLRQEAQRRCRELLGRGHGRREHADQRRDRARGRDRRRRRRRVGHQQRRQRRQRRLLGRARLVRTQQQTGQQRDRPRGDYGDPHRPAVDVRNPAKQPRRLLLLDHRAIPQDRQERRDAPRVEDAPAHLRPQLGTARHQVVQCPKRTEHFRRRAGPQHHNQGPNSTISHKHATLAAVTVLRPHAARRLRSILGSGRLHSILGSCRLHSVSFRWIRWRHGDVDTRRGHGYALDGAKVFRCCPRSWPFALSTLFSHSFYFLLDAMKNPPSGLRLTQYPCGVGGVLSKSATTAPGAVQAAWFSLAKARHAARAVGASTETCA